MTTTRKRIPKAETAKEPAAPLIDMIKDGEVINVCSAQVVHHQALGWKKTGK